MLLRTEALAGPRGTSRTSVDLDATDGEAVLLGTGRAKRLASLLDLGLILAGIAGAIAIIWAMVALVFGFGLVSFSTGSMVPDYPVGSIAVVQTIPLSAAHVGDVVTVDRGLNRLPITHRIVSIAVHSATSATLVLKGDANLTDDPAPYQVTHLRRVVLPLPWIAVIVRFGASPLGMAAVTLVLTLFVTWSLWPTSRSARAA